MVLTLVITPMLTHHLAVSVRSYLPPFVVLSPLFFAFTNQSNLEEGMQLREGATVSVG